MHKYKDGPDYIIHNHEKKQSIQNSESPYQRKKKRQRSLLLPYFSLLVHFPHSTIHIHLLHTFQRKVGIGALSSSLSNFIGAPTGNGVCAITALGGALVGSCSSICVCICICIFNGIGIPIICWAPSPFSPLGRGG